MAFFRVNFGVLQRTKGGDALRRSAYQRCARENGFDYSAKANELTDVFMMMPDAAPAWSHDPQQLWSKLEAAEKRKDAQVGRTIEITIPREVPEQLRSDFVRHCMQPLIRKGMAAEIALHNEIGFDGKEQPHAHALLTMRKLTEDGFSNKVRSWNSDFTAEKGKRMRKQFADRMNQFFEQHGIAATVDHRSHAERGIPVPSPPEISKKHWKKWERHRAADPAAPPPQPIADYLSWKSQRDKEAKAYLRQLKELHNAYSAADHQNHRKEPPAAPRTADRPEQPDLRGSAGSAQHSKRGAGATQRTTGRERRRRPDFAADRAANADAKAAQSDREADHADRKLAAARLRAQLQQSTLDAIRALQKPPERPRLQAAGGVLAPWVGTRIRNEKQAHGVARRWQDYGLDEIGISATPKPSYVLIRGEDSTVRDFGNAMIADRATDEAVAVMALKAATDWGGRLEAKGSQKFLEMLWLECQRQGVEMSVRGDPDWQPPEHIQIQWQTEIELRYVAQKNVNQVDKSEHDAEQPSEAEMLYYQQQQAPAFRM